MDGRETPGFNPQGEKVIEGFAVAATPERIRNLAELNLKLFKERVVEGKDELIKFQEEHPDAKYIIAGTHFTTLDPQAALAELGDRFDIQITGESLVRDELMANLSVKLIGEDRFSTLEYRKTKKGDAGKAGVFNLDDFDAIEKKMDQGRTPWMAVHQYSKSEDMAQAKIGAVYLAHKAGSWIVPTAFYMKGGGAMTLESPADMFKQVVGRLKGKTKAHYKIGTPIKLDPIENLGIIEEVLDKRAAGIKPIKNDEINELAEFARVHKALKDQANQLAEIIAGMLPEQHQGEYVKDDSSEE